MNCPLVPTQGSTQIDTIATARLLLDATKNPLPLLGSFAVNGAGVGAVLMSPNWMLVGVTVSVPEVTKTWISADCPWSSEIAKAQLPAFVPGVTMYEAPELGEIVAMLALEHGLAALSAAANEPV